MFDFADILFSGPCNARCPFCIGQQVSPARRWGNLDEFPVRGLDAWLELVARHNIRQVTLTGVDTDPQLYRREASLLDLLRQRLPAGTQISLHTNGRLALRKMDVFNRYDRATLSIPSFDPSVYRRVMGVPGVPDLAGILQRARIPIKLSIVLTADTAGALPQTLARSRDLGIRRVVLRKLFAENQSWAQKLAFLAASRVDDYRGNPVYQYDGVEITLWDFDATESSSINLYSSGEISERYWLAR